MHDIALGSDENAGKAQMRKGFSREMYRYPIADEIERRFFHWVQKYWHVCKIQ